MSTVYEQYIVWYSPDNFTHLDNAEDAIRIANFVKQKGMDGVEFTVEHFVEGRYIGEADYLVDDFLKYMNR